MFTPTAGVKFAIRTRCSITLRKRQDVQHFCRFRRHDANNMQSKLGVVSR